MSFVSSEAIQKARRIALRGRSAVACIPCKEAKTKCNDYRPCSRCSKLSQESICSDEASNVLSGPRCLKPPLSLLTQLPTQVSDGAAQDVLRTSSQPSSPNMAVSAIGGIASSAGVLGGTAAVSGSGSLAWPITFRYLLTYPQIGFFL